METKEITIELIEKNGFKKYIAGQYILSIGDCFVSLLPMEGWPNANGTWLVTIINNYTNAKIAIIYVHELQQALTLCGVDKKIEV